jgi:hypothetical protein
MKIKGESTSVKVLPWDPFATFNVAVLIHSFVHIGCASARQFYFFILEQKSYLPLKLQFMSGFGKTTIFNCLLGNRPDVFHQPSCERSEHG